MYFRNYRLWKSSLYHSLKGAVSEHALTVNIWKIPKYLRNLHENNFIMFFFILREVDLDYFFPSVRWNLRSGLLTHWLPMSSILFKVVRIYKSQFKCNYLKKEKLFLNFLFDFWILHQILNILKEKMIVIANVFPILQTVKVSVRPLSKKRCVRTRFYIQDVKASKMLWKSPSEIFCDFFIIVREVDLENVSRSVRWIRRGVC